MAQITSTLTKHTRTLRAECHDGDHTRATLQQAPRFVYRRRRKLERNREDLRANFGGQLGLCLERPEEHPRSD